MKRGRQLAETNCATRDNCPVLEACPHDGRLPCLILPHGHAAKLRLCDELEAVADGLPSRVDPLLYLRIANELVPQLRSCHLYEEQVVFPAFIKGMGGSEAARATVRRLQAEHVVDDCAAQDLTEVLLSIGHGKPVDNPEAVGFMLRAFFEALRRHVAFEREHLVPAIGSAAD